MVYSRGEAGIQFRLLLKAHQLGFISSLGARPGGPGAEQVAVDPAQSPSLSCWLFGRLLYPRSQGLLLKVCQGPCTLPRRA